MSSTTDGPSRAPDGPARDLVISYCFPPSVDTAAVLAAKRVWESGRPVDVLQNQTAAERDTDPGLARIADHLVVRRHLVPSPLSFSSWPSIVSFTHLGLQQALAWDREDQGYARMYSGARFPASHILAARLKMLRPRVRWVAEFSDPLSRGVKGEAHAAPFPDDTLLRVLSRGVREAGFEPLADLSVFEWAEVVTYALADEVLFANVQQRDLMVEAVAEPVLRDRIIQVARVSPHPMLGQEYYQLTDPHYPLNPDRRHIGYFGDQVAGGLDSLLVGMEALPKRLRDRVCLHVFTSQPAELMDRITPRGLQEVVRPGHPANFLDFLALCRRMDVLLVNDAAPGGPPAAHPALPSRWSDYKGSGTPIWGIVDEGSVLDRQALAYRSLAGYTSSVVQALARIAGS